MFCDDIIMEMDSPPYWILELSSVKYIPDAVTILNNYAFSEPFEEFSTDLNDFYIACLYIKYERREISWAVFLEKAGNYADGYQCCKQDCEYFYYMLNDYEDSCFSGRIERKQKKEVKSEFKVDILKINYYCERFEKYFKRYVEFEKEEKKLKIGNKIKKVRKYLNLIYSYLIAEKLKTTPFVRIIPTDKCNLNCLYCWQHSNNTDEMSEKEYKAIIKKAKKMKAGIVTFLGGEPLLWEYIYSAIKLCNENNIITDITTNGTLLNEESLNKLGESGLDCLNISVDGKTTEKSIELLIKNLKYINEVRKKYGVKVRVNSVLHKKNFEEIKELIEYCNKENIALSIGYVVPSIDGDIEINSESIYFGKEDSDILNNIVKYIKNKISEKYIIIDPPEYFENIDKFIKKEKFWECNYSGAYGWINVTAGGKIRSCTKKMDFTDYNYLELKSEDIIKIKEEFKKKIKECNVKCYSNCAYDSYYYIKNKWKIIKKW